MTGIVFLTILMLFITPASAFDSSFPDNTVYIVHEFESGFHGGPPGAWGNTDQLFIVKETFTFMADGTFNGNFDNDDSLTRFIGADGHFTTTYEQDSGTDSGTYVIASDGVITLTFSGGDSEVISGTLSENGQIVIFGYGDYSNDNSSASFGFGIGVKKGSGFPTPYLSQDTTYVLNEFESGFHGGVTDAWGNTDQLFAIKDSLTFKTDGTFTGNISYDDSLNRFINADPQGYTFTTTFEQNTDNENGTYVIASDGVVTLTFPEGDTGKAIVSENGQVVTFVHSIYDNDGMYASFGIGVGVKKGSGFSPAFSEDTTFLVNEFESGFHGGVTDAWGANDQLFVVKEIFTFKPDGTFAGNFSNDDSLNRLIGADGNTFTTTYEQDSGTDSGTYEISPDGVITLTFSRGDSEVIPGTLSADGQVITLGNSEYDNSNMYSSFSLGVGIKRPTVQIETAPKSILAAIFLLLND